MNSRRRTGDRLIVRPARRRPARACSTAAGTAPARTTSTLGGQTTTSVARKPPPWIRARINATADRVRSPGA
ncbi:hypothetical protein [Microbispora rosea]|uniref:hypothetical protein n=1 Tax=Microbispora rosea TaxID=58117 RepID=UPI003446B387